MIQQIKREVTAWVVDPASNVVKNLGEAFALNAQSDGDADRYELGIFGRFLGGVCKRVFAAFPRLARAIEYALKSDPDAQQRLGELRIPGETTSFIFDVLTLGIRAARDEEKLKKQQEDEADKIAIAKKKEEEARQQIEAQLCQFELPSTISLDKVREIILAGKFNQFTLLIQKLKNGGEISDDDMLQCGMSPIDFNRSFEPAALKAKLPKRDFNKEQPIAETA